MNAAEILRILNDPASAPEKRAAALVELESLTSRAAVALSAPAPAPLDDIPFDGAELLPAESISAPKDSPLDTRSGQSEAVPTCINLQDASDWPDEVISMADLWAYYGEDGVGVAKLYNRLNRHRVVKVPEWNKFLVWQGNYWAHDRNNSIAAQRVESVVAQFRKLMDEQKMLLETITDKDERRAMEKKIGSMHSRISSLRSLTGVKNVLEQIALVGNPLVVTPESIDKKPELLPCSNGVVNLKTGDMRPGEPTDWMHVNCATPFDPALLELDDPCPATTKFLIDSMNGDKELADFIWRILGYGLYRYRKDQKFFIFWGPHGRNGKDTLIKIITSVLGPKLSGTVNMEMFLQSNMPRNSAGPSPDVMDLKGSCIRWGNEAEENQRFSMSKLKEYNGNGNMKARGLMDKDFTEFQQTHLLIMCTNELPKAKADDDAFWHRFIVVKWELSFVDEPKEDYQRPADKDLDAKLEAEKQGVLARLVQGCMEYLRDGLKVPEKVKGWNEEVRNSFDDVSQFLEDCCERERKQADPNAYRTSVSAKELNCAWTLWYADNRDRRHIPSGKTLGVSLDKKEIPKKHSNGTRRMGLCLKPDWDAKVQDELRKKGGYDD